jgi:hypothetical protein
MQGAQYEISIETVKGVGGVGRSSLIQALLASRLRETYAALVNMNALEEDA